VKHLVLNLFVGLACISVTPAFADVVILPKANDANTTPPVVQDYLSVLNPTVSVIEGSQVPVPKVKKSSKSVVTTDAVALLATTPDIKPKTKKGKKTANSLVSAPAILVNDPLDPTPEPPYGSLLLAGLFGTGFLLTRRHQARKH
jgi:hypothetical protein